MIDFKDFYIEYPGHPSYEPNTIIEDDVIRVIIQKYEMILFTNQGELLGDPNFGGNLEELLYETKVSAAYVESQLNSQIVEYIPEIADIGYKLEAVFAQDTENYQEMLFINFELKDYKVFAQIGKLYGGF
jgi:phage baseplate assembly protein W